MATPAGILTVLVRANTASANLGLAKVNAQARLTAGRFGEVDKASAKTSGSLAKFAKAGAGAAAGGLLVFVGAAKKAVDEARDAEKTMAQTEAVLKSTGGTAKVSAKEVENLAERLSLVAGVDDEVIQKGENLLLTFKDIRNEAGKGNDIFNQTVKATLDMAAAMAAASGGTINLKSAGIQVGKALNDPIKGLTALTRVGVTFSEQQKEQITRLVESGDKMKAQKIILKELRSEFGGSAKANADAMDKLTVAIDNLFEKFGKQLIPIIEDAATWLVRFIIQMNRGKGAGGQFVHTLQDIWKAVKVVIDIFKVWIPFLLQLPRLWVRVGRAGVNAALAIWGAMKDVFQKVKKAAGDAIAFVLRRFADLLDVAAKLPIIGDKFKGIADKVRTAANRVDRLGENIDKLPKKVPIKVQVDLLMKDFLSGDVPKLQKFPGGGPKGLLDTIKSGAKKRSREWALDHLDQIAPLLGAPGAGNATLSAIQKISLAMGLSGGLGSGQGYRAGDPGWHGRGRALDNSGPAGQMMKFAQRMFVEFGQSLKELIYSPMGVGIKNGSAVNIRDFYGASVYADHFDHVHVAAQRGGRIGGSGSGDRVPALLEPGEFVMNRNATRAAGPMLAALNRGVPRFANGGMVKALHALHRVGATAEEEGTLGAIAGAETGWAWKTGGLGEKTPWQFLPSWFDDARGMGINLFTWGGAAKMALWLKRKYGYSQWSTYNDGKYKGFLSQIEKNISGGKNTGRLLVEGGGHGKRTVGKGFPKNRSVKGAAGTLLKVVPPVPHAPRQIRNIDQEKGGAGGGGGEDTALVDAMNQQTAATEAHTAALIELRLQQRRNEDLIRGQGPSLAAGLIQMVNGGIGGPVGLGRQFPSSTGLGGLSRA